MAVIVTCPACAQRSQVPDQFAGSTVKCPHCSALVAVPAAAAGRAGTFQPPAWSPSYSRPAAGVPSAFTCVACGGSFPADQVYEQEGSIICHGCYAQAAQAAHAAPAETHAAQEPAETTIDYNSELESISSTSKTMPHAPRRKGWEGTIWASAAGVVALTFVILWLTGTFPRRKPVEVAMPTTAPVEAPEQVVSEWEKYNGPKISRFRSQAKVLEASSDTTGAFEKYEQAMKLAEGAGSATKSTGLVAELDDIKSRYDELGKTVLPARAAAAAAALPKPPKRSDDLVDVPPVALGISDRGPVTRLSQDAEDALFEPTHKAELLELIAQADDAKAKAPLDALVKYNDVSLMVGRRRKLLKDAELKTKLAAADESRKQLIATLRDTPPAQALSAKMFLAAALRAENDGKWTAALDYSLDARRLMEKQVQGVARFHDKDYITTLHSLVVSYLAAKKLPKAEELLADGEPLGKTISSADADPPRSLVWNRSVADMQQKNVMRVIKTIKDFMGRHREVDEQLLNFLGTALNAADEAPPTDRRPLDDAIGFYGQRNMDLEHLRPGERRWGIQWLPAPEFIEKSKDQNKAIELWQEKIHDKEAAAAKVKEAEANVRNKAAGTPAETRAALLAAKSNLEMATREIGEARSAVPRAPWLTNVMPIVPGYGDAVPPPAPPIATTAPVEGAGKPLGSTDGPAPTPAAPDAQTAPETPKQTPIPVPKPPAVIGGIVRYGLAFPVDATHLVTATEPLGKSSSVRLVNPEGTVATARVVNKDERLALLEIDPAEVGGPLHYFNLASDYPGGAVRCVGAPDASLFAPITAFVAGENIGPAKTAVWSVGLADHPRLAGSPLIDAQNKVIGVVVSQRDDSRQKLPAVALKELQAFCRANKVAPASPGTAADLNSVYQVAASAD